MTQLLSMPLATLRAQSITDSYKHFICPQPPDFQLAAIPHTREWKPHQRKSTRRCLTWLLSIVLPTHPGGESPKTSMMRMPSAEQESAEHTALQQQCREGCLWSRLEGLRCHFKKWAVTLNFFPTLFNGAQCRNTWLNFSLCPPAWDEKKTTTKSQKLSDIWEVWRRSGSDRLLRNRSDLSYINYYELNFYPISCALLAVSATQ